MIRRAAVHLGVIASYLGIALFHLRPLGSVLTTHMQRGGNEDVWLHGWILNWTARALGRDPLSMFDSNAFFPYPKSLAYTTHFIAQALPVAPLRAFTDDPVVIYNVAFLLTFVLAGWFTFLLVRRLTGDPWAAWVAGAFACWFPAKRWSLAHINTITLHWVPLALLCLHRMIERPRVWIAAAAGLTVALASLSSDYYTFYFPILLVFGLPLLPWAQGEPLDRRRVAAIVGAGVVTAAVMAPVLAVYAGLWIPERGGDRALVATVSGLDVRDLVTIESWAWSAVLPEAMVARASTALFPGLVALVLAAGAFLGGRTGARGLGHRLSASPRLARWYAFMIGLALLIAFGHRLTVFGWEGPYLPTYWVVQQAPFLNNLRAPLRAAFLGVACGAVLVGMGAAWLLRWARERHGLRPAMVALVLVALMQFEMAGAAIPPRQPPTPRPVDRWLAAQPQEFGIVELPMPPELWQTARGQWLSTYHWKRRVTGHNGFLPAGVERLHAISRPMLNDTFMDDLLRNFPVRYVLLDVVAHGDPEEVLLAERLEALGGRLQREERVGDVVVLRVENGGDVGVLRRRFPRWMIGGTLRLTLEEPVPVALARTRLAVEIGEQRLETIVLRRGHRVIEMEVPPLASEAPLQWLVLRLREAPAPLRIRRIEFVGADGTWP